MADAKKIEVAFISVSTESSTDRFIERIKQKNDDLRCTFVKLRQEDLQSFEPQEKFDAVVLLHSISQGRNSITDVADAKYDKLLPQLKKKYGPDRVAVVVHSLISFNLDTKMALMMVFKKSQPTTFNCSNCVIQCNNPSEMEDQDLSRLVDFLVKAPECHFPVAEIETPPKNSPATRGALSSTTGQPGNKLTSSNTFGNIRPHDYTNALAIAKYDNDSEVMRSKVETVHRKEYVDPRSHSSHFDYTKSQPGRKRTDSNKTCGSYDTSKATALESKFPSYARRGNEGGTSGNCAALKDYLHNPSSSSGLHDINPRANSGNAQLDREKPGTSQIGASSLLPIQPPSQEQAKQIDTTYPIGLLGQKSEAFGKRLEQAFNKKLGLHHYQKSVMIIRDDNISVGREIFETVLINVGTDRNPDQKVMRKVKHIRKMMKVPENIGFFMQNTASSTTTALNKDISQLMNAHGSQVFPYQVESESNVIFDDHTIHRLVSWLCDCSSRFCRLEDPTFLET